MHAVDPLHDAALSLADAGLDAETIRRVLADVRRRWTGRVYVRSVDPLIDAEISRRIAAGEHPEKIARETGRHRTTIIRRRRSTW